MAISLGITLSSIEKVSSFERLLVFLITDLSAIKEIESKLKEKEHLALIGEMAAGIAHEIRNPLASISGSVQFLRRELTLQPELRSLMDIIVKESDRLSAFIEEFLNFSRQSPLEKTDFDLGGVVDDVTAMIARNLKAVRFIKKYDPGNMIGADVKKIKQLAVEPAEQRRQGAEGEGEHRDHHFPAGRGDPACPSAISEWAWTATSWRRSSSPSTPSSPSASAWA